MNINTVITDIAQKVSEDYIISSVDMNSSLIEHAMAGDIANDDILKRICEKCNQNVYLSLFNDPSVDKSNITFDLADFNRIKSIIDQSEKSMSDYATPPDDNRLLPTVLLNKTASAHNELNYANTVIEYSNVIDRAISAFEMLKTSSIRDAEAAFLKMANDARAMVVRGDSIADIAKVACVNVKNHGGDFTKVATAYDVIKKDLLKDGFKVSEEFTKTSSLSPNPKSALLAPSKEYSDSLLKIAGFNDMLKKARVIKGMISQEIEKFTK